MSAAIIEKIQKLLALASNSGATEAESANAAAVAQRLLQKHNLELSEVLEAAKAKGEEPVLEPITSKAFCTSKRVAHWMGVLSNTLAPAFSCRVYKSRGRITEITSLVVAGRPVNIEAFVATFNYLVGQIERLSKAAKPYHVHGREWTPSFATGCILGISDRITEERRQIEESNPGMALMLVNEESALETFMAPLKLRSGTSSSRVSSSGISAGRNAASSLNLGSVPGRTQNNALRLNA